MTTNEDVMDLSFGLVKQTQQIAIPDIRDSKVAGTKWIKWGEDNKAPKALWDLYLECSNLQSIVNTIHDYVIGEGINTDYALLSDEDETLDEVIKKNIFDYILFGGFAIEGIRNAEGKIVRLNYVNVMNVRVDEELTTAYLSNKWGSWSGKDVTELPLFDKSKAQPHFLFFYRGSITRNINPVPMYISALKSIEILSNTRNFHLHNLENNFSANAIINLNNGNIKTKELQEIKEKLEKGYCGTDNAGRFLLINGGDRAHAATVERLEADKFGELYKALDESSKEDIYTAFRINPILLGNNVSTGFSKQEFAQAFALYNKTMIQPIQNAVSKALLKLGVSVRFIPFNVEWAAE